MVLATAKVLTLLASCNFFNQVRIKLISQLIKDNLRVFKKLLKYFNGTTIYTFIIPCSFVFAKNLDLNLCGLGSVMGFFGSPL